MLPDCLEPFALPNVIETGAGAPGGEAAMGRIGRLGVVAVAVAGSGCLVHVDHVREPEAAFQEAREDAARARRHGGAPHELGLLAYDPSDGELVRVELPLWLVRRACQDGGDFGVTLDDDRLERLGALRQRWRWEDLEDAGPGVLLEVHDAGERVLVWLR
jgi:hypothetical protein